MTLRVPPRKGADPLANYPLQAAWLRSRFLRALFGALLAAAPVCSAPLGAQEPEVIHLPPPSQSTPATPGKPPRAATRASLNVQEVLAELWFRRNACLERNDLAAARRQVELMRDVVRREGIFSAEDVAGAFLSDGNRALESRNRTRALESFHLASEFAPDEPGAFFGLARTLWSQEKDLGGALSSVIQGIRATLRNPSARTARLGNILLVMLTGSLGAAVLWSLLCALRTARLSQHDLYERQVRSFSPAAAHAVAWSLWFLPALLWFAGWWLLVYWLALSQPYLKRSERILSVLACLCFLAAVPLVSWITLETAVTTNPTTRFLLEAARGGVDPERIPILEQMASARPREALYHFLLGQTYAATGSTEAALQEYRQVQTLKPDHAKAWINSGSLLYSKQRFAQAAEEYRRAAQSDPHSALAEYNLSLALQALLRLEEADAAFRKARELDNSLITSILASSGTDEQRDPMDAHYTTGEVLEVLQKSGGSSSGTTGWRQWVSPLSLSGALGLLACLVSAWLSSRWGLGRAQKCGKCGQPFCRRCQVGMKREEGLCTACRHLYVLKDPVAPAAREARERLVASHERWEWILRRLVSLCLPGAGQIRGGRTVWGAFLIWVASVGVATLLLTGKSLAYPGIPVLDSTTWVRVAAVVCVAGAWLAANTLAFQKGN